jgi:hypothetical protein
MNATTVAKKPFVLQMLDYFGLRPGQSKMQFSSELKPLSHEDKVEFAAMLTAAGLPCDAPTLPQIAA